MANITLDFVVGSLSDGFTVFFLTVLMCFNVYYRRKLFTILLIYFPKRTQGCSINFRNKYIEHRILSTNIFHTISCLFTPVDLFFKSPSLSTTFSFYFYNNQLFVNMYSRTHGIPAVFSFFFPGFGQLVKGHLFKAFAIWLIGGTLMFIFWWTVFVPLGIWIWNVYDAYSTNSSM